MKLLPIDPSINTLGFAYFEDGSYKGAETLNIPNTEGLRERLGALGEGVKKRVQLFQPDIVLIEQAGKWTRAGKNIEAL